jgi:trimethylamine--corrinoid protein Co-methyltransferase
VPANVISVPLAGATAPVTLRDTVVQHCAEDLSGVVIHQLARRGAPLVWGAAAAAFDMRRGTAPLAAPESMLMAVATAEVGRHLGLPTHAYLALSEAKGPDYQAGLETGTGALVAALAGINLVSGPGLLDYLLTQSPEKLLLDHEACGFALRFARGIGGGAEDLEDLWRELARDGQLLSHPHTRRHWRDELSVPSALLDRETYGDGEARGARDAAVRAREERQERPRRRHAGPGLAGDRARALEAVMADEARRCGLPALPA